MSETYTAATLTIELEVIRPRNPHPDDEPEYTFEDELDAARTAIRAGVERVAELAPEGTAIVAHERTGGGEAVLIARTSGKNSEL